MSSNNPLFLASVNWIPCTLNETFISFAVATHTYYHYDKTEGRTAENAVTFAELAVII
jgi:hypothetical protein